MAKSHYSAESRPPAYEKWEQETLAKGRQEGRQETPLEIVRRMLWGDLPLEAIALVTGFLDGAVAAASG